MVPTKLSVNVPTMADCFDNYVIPSDGIDGAKVSDAQFIQTLEFPMKWLGHDVGKVLLQPTYF